MTTICGGPSAPKAGINTSIIVDEGYVRSILPPTVAWVYPYLPGMGGLAIGDIPTFCSIDPPSFTVPSAAELFGYLSGSLNQFIAVNTFLENLVKAYLWYTLCECTSVATPAPPAGPSAPADLPAINPPNIVSPNAARMCGTLGTESVDISDNAAHYLFGTFTNGTNVNVPPGLFKPMPSGITTARITVTTQTITGTPRGSNVTIGFVNAAHTVFSPGGPTGIGADTTNVVFDQAMNDVTKTQCYVNAQASTTGTSTIRVTVTVDFYCSGVNPNTSQADCACPPDPVLLAKLHQLMEMVTLIQRQAAPFSYVYGTDHTALSGDGSFAVQGLLGVSIDVTTLPNSYGRAAGEPEELFGLGFVTLGTDDGYEQSRRIDHDGTLFLPPLPGLFTVVGYSLSPGVVVSIRELVREP